MVDEMMTLLSGAGGKRQQVGVVSRPTTKQRTKTRNTVSITKQLKDEMITDQNLPEKEIDPGKPDCQGLMKTETEEISVLTRAIEQKTIRQKKLR